MSSLATLQVLIVDDNAHMRTLVTTILTGAGFMNIRRASDGAEALKILKTFEADLAIVDFSMSPMDGVEFTRIVRNDPNSENPYLPIIMMTGHSERTRVYAARDSGITEFVVKPITANSILSRVQAVIFKPRPFVRTEDYFGPCRRRHVGDDPNYTGPLRREGDAGNRAQAIEDYAGEAAPG
jgi:two-component system chemotaxis response regulator CheY